jgi:hypothetical protein
VRRRRLAATHALAELVAHANVYEHIGMLTLSSCVHVGYSWNRNLPIPELAKSILFSCPRWQKQNWRSHSQKSEQHRSASAIGSGLYATCVRN